MLVWPSHGVYVRDETTWIHQTGPATDSLLMRIPSSKIRTVITVFVTTVGISVRSAINISIPA